MYTEDMNLDSYIKNCRLGKWINQMKNEDEISSLAVFKDLEGSYQAFHQKLATIYQLYNHGQVREIEREMVEFESLSNIVLDKIIVLQKEFNKQGKVAFA